MPYFGLSDAQVITAVVHGNPPNASIFKADKLEWIYVKRCWSAKVEDRPSAANLLDAFLYY